MLLNDLTELKILHRVWKEREMPHRTRPLTGLLLFTGINAVLVQTITPVYDFVCFLPYWEKRVCMFVLE